ncbi:MAG: serine hydrolase [Cryomorphaceae bacterium]
MQKLIITFALTVFGPLAFSQTYFPPVSGSEWETVSPSEFNWCDEKIDTLISYLESRNTKSFIILKGGRIALEHYLGTFTADSNWYWASAAKTLTATLTGAALEDGDISLDDPVSQYLGEGWTDCTVAEETTRTIWHQLTMTSSFLNDSELWDCVEPECFQCTELEPGDEWHYHNGVYRRLIDVLEEATGLSRNFYTTQKIKTITGMQGLWVDQLYFSNTRSMARFGLLAQENFVWDGTPVLNNQEYISAMTTPSQDLNESYGYLWWLNGQSSHMAPLVPFVSDGSIVPSAPDDMYAGMGANEQRVYVVPSQDMVVVRMGEAAYDFSAAFSGFDPELWELISDLECETVSVHSDPEKNSIQIFPNPASGRVNIKAENADRVDVFTASGIKSNSIALNNASLEINLPAGMYFFQFIDRKGNITTKKVVIY